jgi:hypothetical protein
VNTSRPRERGDPYAVTHRWSNPADTFCHNRRPGLWVPAFAGTTNDHFVSGQPESLADGNALSPGTTASCL